MAAPAPYIVVINNTVESGLAVYTQGLVNALRGGGHPVTLVETKNDIMGKYLTEGDGLRRIHRPLPENGSGRALYRQWRDALAPLRDGRPARVIYNRGRAGECSAAILLALRRLFDGVYTLEMTPPPPEGWDGRPLRDTFRRRLRNRLTNTLIRRSIVLSRDTQRIMREVYHMPARKLAVCPPWVDTEHFRPDEAARQRVRASLGIAPSTFVVGSLNRLAEEKRPLLLVDGFAQFVKNYRADARLIMAGAGPLRGAIEERAAALGIADRVTLPGFVADAAEWHRAYDLEVLTSLLEGGPITMMEAMACGTLYLGHPTGEVADCIRTGTDGFVVEMHDAQTVADSIAKIAALPEAEKSRLRESARQRIVDRYSPAVSLAHLCTSLDAADAAAALQNK